MLASLWRSLASALLLALSASCASLMTGSEDAVTILSDPPGAKFKTNTGHSGSTPSTITIADDVVLQVDYSLDGYERATAELHPQASGWVLGNVIFGGLIGIVIDFASGNYQTHAASVCATLSPAPKIRRASTPSSDEPQAPPVWTGYDKPQP